MSSRRSALSWSCWRSCCLSCRVDASARHIERVIGSLRCECLNRVIVLNEIHLRRMLRAYLASTIGRVHISH